MVRWMYVCLVHLLIAVMEVKLSSEPSPCSGYMMFGCSQNKGRHTWWNLAF